MEPVTTTAIIVAIIVGVGVDLSTHAIRNGAMTVWNAARGRRLEAAPTADRRSEAVEALHLNVSSTSKRLRDIIDHVVKGNQTSLELRGALDEVRGEFLRHRSSWIVIGDTGLLQKVERWHDDVRRIKDDIANEEGAWITFMNTSPTHPPEVMIPPAKKRLGEYQGLLVKGDELGLEVEKLREPKAPAAPPPSEARRARDRLAARLMLLSGQFDTLGHWLGHLGGLSRIENVLVDIEKLAEGHSHIDLDIMDDAPLGKSIIAYYRDVRGALENVRGLAKTFDRLRTMSDRDQRLHESLNQAQAHAAQCSREGARLAQELREG